MMKRLRQVIIVFAVLLMLNFNASAEDGVKKLSSLVYSNNPVLKSIREDIKRSIYTIKSRRNVQELPELKFYTYRVKEKENFWIVMSKCSLDMDTMMTVNGLTSPYQVVPGTTLYIPNMRGVIVPGDDRKALASILAAEKIHPGYVRTVNKSRNLDKKYIFVPCGKVSTLERSMFLGTAFLSPIHNGRKTSGFGSRRDPFNEKRREFHRGVDIGCHVGTRVYSARSGVVVFSGYEEGYGKLVIIEHEYGYRTYYGHLSRIDVRQGDSVKPGEAIALSGNTGRSTGPHLHFEIRKNGTAMNPMTFIRSGH